MANTTLDLNKCFPQPEDTTKRRGPLPKQQEFLDLVLDRLGPSNIAYFGGYGSGKSLILCIANIIQGVMFGGEYVISRQFMPELRRTTMKLFHQLLPPELVIDKKDAVAETTIKSINGTATFYFVGLDEPDKLDSLTLDGASIDEASQITEEAFLKLQGRLRGLRGLRKMLLVGNPKGHDYVYKYFISKKSLADFYHPTLKRTVTVEEQSKQYKIIIAPSTENHFLTPDYLQKMFSTYSKERIQRDVYGNFDSFEGQVFSEFDRSKHVVRPFKIPENWNRHIRIDYGYRNPTSVGFYAVSPEGDVFKYKEIYVKEWLVKEVCQGDPSSKKEGITSFIRNDASSFIDCKIDPSTKARNGIKGESVFDEFRRWWPKNLPPLGLAKNDKQLGIDRVKQYLKPMLRRRTDPKTGKSINVDEPALYFFETCVNTIDEHLNYRYQEQRPNEVGVKSEKEEPRKVNDHAVDETRYMVVDLPERYKPLQDEIDRHKKYTQIEIRMQDEFKKLTSPKEGKDPFSDGI